MIVSLTWPPKDLSPNARTHWAPRSRLKAVARKYAKYATIETMQRHSVGGERFHELERLPMKISFYPPDKRRRDDDNMIGSFKSYRDGIADALGLDDVNFQPHYFFEEPKKPGFIVVEIG